MPWLETLVLAVICGGSICYSTDQLAISVALAITRPEQRRFALLEAIIWTVILVFAIYVLYIAFFAGNVTP